MDMERIFRVVVCTNERKILFAVDTFQEEAQHWWQTKLGPRVPITWKDFLEVFRKRYFPPSVYEQKKQEFLCLNVIPVFFRYHEINK